MSIQALENLEQKIGIVPGSESGNIIKPENEIAITDAQRQDVISWLIIKGVDKNALNKSSLVTLGKMYRINKYLNAVLMAQERDQKRKPYRNLVAGFDSDNEIFPTPTVAERSDAPPANTSISPTPTPNNLNPNQLKPVIEVIARQIIKDELNRLNQQFGDLATDLTTTLKQEIQTQNKGLSEELKKLVEDIIFQSYLNQKINNQKDIDPTPVADGTSAPPASSNVFIPKIDPNYHFDPYASKVIRSALSMGENLYVYGDTGCGKTTHLEQVCAVMDRGLVRINPHDGITREMFLGGMKLINNETIFVEGALPLAMRNGLVFLVDEISFLPPNLTAILNPIGEKNGKLYIPETNEWLSPTPGFCIFATDNTGGKGDRTGNYTGTEVQNTATLDRFAFCLKMDYLPREKEYEMLINRFPNQNQDEIKGMLGLAQDIRQAFSRGELSLTLSTRKLIKFFDQRQHNFTTQEALSNTILSWLDEDDETLVKTMIDRLDLLSLTSPPTSSSKDFNLKAFQIEVQEDRLVSAIKILRTICVDHNVVAWDLRSAKDTAIEYRDNKINIDEVKHRLQQVIDGVCL